MRMISFLLELISYIFVFRNVIGSSFTPSRLRHTLAITLTIAWIIYMSLFMTNVPYTIAILLLMLILFSDKWYQLLCFGILYSLILNIFSSIVYCLAFFLTHDSTVYSGVPVRYINLLQLCGMILGSFMLRRQHLRDFLYLLTKPGYLLFTFVILTDFVLSSISYVFLTEDASRGRLVIGIFMLALIVMSVILMVLYLNLKKYQHTLLQMNEENQHLLELEVLHYKELQQKNQDLRAFRHDFSYHVTAMQGLFTAKDWDGLSDYINALSEMKEHTYSISTNHPVADAVVNYFYERKPDDVYCYVQGKLPPHISVSDTDLCIILSNLLRNAMESVDQLDSTCEKKIYLSFFFHDTIIEIHVENTSRYYTDDELAHLSTTKSDTQNHGFGLKNVAEALQRNNGQMNIQFRDSLFCVCAAMQNI